MHTSFLVRYKGYDFVILSNGKAKGGTPEESIADNIFYKVLNDTGL